MKYGIRIRSCLSKLVIWGLTWFMITTMSWEGLMWMTRFIHSTGWNIRCTRENDGKIFSVGPFCVWNKYTCPLQKNLWAGEAKKNLWDLWRICPVLSIIYWVSLYPTHLYQGISEHIFLPVLLITFLHYIRCCCRKEDPHTHRIKNYYKQGTQKKAFGIQWSG